MLCVPFKHQPFWWRREAETGLRRCGTHSVYHLVTPLRLSPSDRGRSFFLCGKHVCFKHSISAFKQSIQASAVLMTPTGRNWVATGSLGQSGHCFLPGHRVTGNNFFAVWTCGACEGPGGSIGHYFVPGHLEVTSVFFKYLLKFEVQILKNFWAIYVFTQKRKRNFVQSCSREMNFPCCSVGWEVKKFLAPRRCSALDRVSGHQL